MSTVPEESEILAAQNWTPTATPMVVSPVSYLSTVRTTLCDIMCTTNCAFAMDGDGLKALKPLHTAILPYPKMRSSSVADIKQTPGYIGTQFQTMRINNIKGKRQNDLKRDRMQYFDKVAAEKAAKDVRRECAAIIIQASFRGYFKRNAMGRIKKLYSPKRKKQFIASQNNLQDDLCRLFAKLPLKPIDGLNLEPRSKSTRRKARFETAAAYRLQRFFKMIAAQKKARRLVAVKRVEMINRCARVVTRAIRFMRTKLFTKRCMEVKRNRISIKIQSAYRVFQAKAKVRQRRHEKLLFYRRNEAAIIIQRNFAPKNMAASVYRVSMRTLRTVRGYVTYATDVAEEALAEELLVSITTSIASTISLQQDEILADAVFQLEKCIFEVELEDAVDIAGPLWVEEQMKAIEAENLRLQKEREEQEARMRMLEEAEEHKRQAIMLAEALVASEKLHTEQLRHKDEKIVQALAADGEVHVTFADDTAPDFVLNKAARDFIDTITDQVFTKVLSTAMMSQMIEQAQKPVEGSEADESIGKMSAVTFGNENDPDYDLSDCASNFVNKITSKVISRQSSPIVNSRVSLFDRPHELDAGGTVNKKVGTDKEEEEEEEEALKSDSLLTSSVTDYVTDLTSASIQKLSKPNTPAGAAISCTLNDEGEPEAKGIAMNGTENSFRNDSEPVVVFTNVEDSVEGSEDDRSASQQPEVSKAAVPTWYFRAIADAECLSEIERANLHDIMKMAFQLFSAAKYTDSLEVLEEATFVLNAVMDKETTDDTAPTTVLLQSSFQCLHIQNHFALANYKDAKSLIDGVISRHTSAFGAESYHMAEALFYLADTHRALGNYNEAEKYFFQSSSIVEQEGQYLRSLQEKDELPKYGTERQLECSKLFLLLLIRQAELFRNCGQYYKANEFSHKVQETMRLQKKSNQKIDFEIQSEFVVALVALYILKGKYENAISLHQELLDKRRVYYGLKHPKVASSMSILGSLMLLKCNFTEAARLIEESLEMRQEFYPSHHPAIAASLYLKGQALNLFGNFQDAIINVTSSLDIRVFTLGPNHPSVAQSLVGLAKVQTAMGRVKDGSTNFQRGLQIFLDRFATELHCNVADTIFNMGINSMALGQPLKAITYFEQALELREVLMPLYGTEVTSHVDVELSRVYLAHCYCTVSRIDEAKKIIKEAVKTLCVLLGNNNLTVAKTLSFLGELCKIRGNYSDAKTLFSLSFNVVNQLFGDTHPAVAELMLESADNFRIPGYYKEAQELVLSAIDIRQYLFGGDSISIAHALFNKAQIVRDASAGRNSSATSLLKEAENLYLEAREIIKNRIDENCAFNGVILAHLGECYRLQGMIDAAEKAFNEAIAILKDTYGNESVVVGETLTSYAILLIDMRNSVDAQMILNQAVVPIMSKLLGDQHPLCMYAKANLALATELVNAPLPSQVGDGVSQAENSSFIGTALSEDVYHNPEIQEFLGFCKSSLFADDHPWVVRFTGGWKGLLSSSSIASSYPASSSLYSVSASGASDSQTRDGTESGTFYSTSTSSYTRGSSTNSRSEARGGRARDRGRPQVSVIQEGDGTSYEGSSSSSIYDDDGESASLTASVDTYSSGARGLSGGDDKYERSIPRQDEESQSVDYSRDDTSYISEQQSPIARYSRYDDDDSMSRSYTVDSGSDSRSEPPYRGTSRLNNPRDRRDTGSQSRSTTMNRHKLSNVEESTIDSWDQGLDNSRSLEEFLSTSDSRSYDSRSYDSRSHASASRSYDSRTDSKYDSRTPVDGEGDDQSIDSLLS